MKKILFFSLLISSLTITNVKAELKIAVIEGKEILSTSKEGQEINKAITEKREQLTQEITSLDQKLEKEANEIRSKQRTISPEALESKQEAFFKSQRARDARVQEAENEFKSFTNRRLAKFDAKLREKLKHWGENNQFDIVSLKETGEIIYASKKADYTKQVVDILDTEFSKENKADTKAVTKK